MDNATLTAAFKAGEAAHAEGKSFTQRLLQPKGKARDFWEHGFIKAQKAAEALYNSPESKAQRLEEQQARVRAARENRAKVRAIQEESEVNALLAGKLTDMERVRIALNAAIGITTTYNRRA